MEITRILNHDMQTEYKYITPIGEIHSGENAFALLANKIPTLNIREYGIYEADEDRWQEAQAGESFVWMELEKQAEQDRNTEHRKRFNNYDYIRSMHFKNVIELGCGPFTNFRIIQYEIDYDKLTLLDPLITTYLKHEKCTYRNYEKEGIRLVSGPIEAFKTDEKYDLVIMINVLEHCFNIAQIFNVIDKILATDGLFIFADSGIDKAKILERCLCRYDAHHPLIMSDDFLERYIQDNYSVKYFKKYSGLYGDIDRRDYYYILSKRGERTKRDDS